MFDGLQGKLQNTFRRLKGEGRVSEEILQEALREIRLALGGVPVPLTQLGTVEIRRGEAEILRRDRQKRISVYANIGEGTLSETVALVKEKTDQLALPPGYRIQFAGMYEFQQESFAIM